MYFHFIEENRELTQQWHPSAVRVKQVLAQIVVNNHVTTMTVSGQNTI